MSTLRLRWSGGEVTFEPGTTVHIGRDPGAEVRLDNSNVSRRHAEVQHSPNGWTLVDVGSAQGTWRDGRRVETVDVRGTVQVTLGKEGRGEVVTLESAVVAQGGAPFPGVAATEIPGTSGAAATGFAEPTQVVGRGVAADAAAGTVVVGGREAQRPGGALRADAVAADTVVTGDVLNVECAGRSYTFAPGRDVTIGRDDACDVVTTNPTVSRVHARLTYDAGTWNLRDAQSSGGTFVDGERVTTHPLAGSTAAWLGDPTAGERVVLVTRGESKPARRRTLPRTPGRIPQPVLIAGAVVIAALLVLLIARLVRSEESLSRDDLGRATVRLVAGDRSGSGSIVDARRGLILTNAHVVAPDAAGTGVRDRLFESLLDTSPREVSVLVAPALGSAAEPRYIAKVVAVDGYLDLAVLRIVETTGGQLVSEGSPELDGLVEVDIGNSSGLGVGDKVRVFGYPGAAQSGGATATEGTVSSLVADRRLGSNSAMLNISADIRPGNSGGLAVDDRGRLVGIPTLIRGGSVPSMRPSSYATALIDAARAGEDYESEWVNPLSGEKITNVDLVTPRSDGGIEFACRRGSTSTATGAIGVAFDFSGFEAGEHQDVLIAVRHKESIIGLWAVDLEYPVEWPSSSGCATVSVPLDPGTFDVDELRVTIGVGPNYDPDR